MKKLLVFFLLMTILAPAPISAQDETLVKYVASDGSFSVMIPEGWHVREYLEIDTGLMITNNPKLLSEDALPSSIESGDIAINCSVTDEASAFVGIQGISPEMSFEQKAAVLIDYLEKILSGEFRIVDNKIDQDTLIDGSEVILARLQFSDLDMVLTLHQSYGRVVMFLGVGRDNGDALRDLMLQMLPTVEVVGDVGTRPVQAAPPPKVSEESRRGSGEISFVAVGDPLLEVDVQGGYWQTKFAPVSVLGEAVQSFKFQISAYRATKEDGAWLEFSGLPTDIQPGIYPVDELDPIIAQLNVFRSDGGFGGVPLVGMLTIELAGESITGHFDLQTKPSDAYPFDITSVTGNFADIVIPVDHVRDCVRYAGLSAGDASAQFHIAGIDVPDAMWIVEPVGASLNVYVTSGQGFGEGSYVLLAGIRRDIASGVYFISPYQSTGMPRAYLIKVSRGADGSLVSDGHLLRGAVHVVLGDDLSGDVDLVLIDAEDIHIRGSFAHLRLPGDSCS